MNRFLAALALACAFSLSAAPAQAGEFATALYGVVQPYLAELKFIAASALVGWFARTVLRFTGIKLDEKHRATLETTFTNAAGLVIARAGSAAQAARLPIGSSAFDSGLAAVARGAGDAITHFGLTPKVLADKLTAKIGVLAAGGGK